MTEMWKTKAETLRFNEGLSWTEIASQMQSEFPDLTFSQVREKLRDHCRSCAKYKEKFGRPTLVFSDVHAPFDHRDFPDFLRRVNDRYKCGKVVCLGDLVDNHTISRHTKEPCADGLYTELDNAKDRLKIYTTIFPEVTYVLGNHDLRPEMIAKECGIGARYLKTMHELLSLPDGWECAGDEFIADDVLYCHGINCSGKNGALNKAIQERMSVCIGHSHSFGGIQFSANKRDTIFGMNVGCGIDENRYAFAYGKHSKFRSTLGCGVVFSPSSAVYIPMERI